ncbi:HER026Cp [Eremothecium sinecaudum]|uniref:HER026Cp n=1 Tax=Eremothecium sinecaudum TaxID=45286 RepID=A0A0X8HTU2_9SACH|nr:HER026Cp [Eremothecium sinecaudum]AMD21305.1 HER026Cp [Eremothecium sinecaudum]
MAVDTIKRRKKTNIACINCSRSHVTCERTRPCSRCIKKGLVMSCVDAPRKRRKYLADVPEDQLPASLKVYENEGDVEDSIDLEKSASTGTSVSPVVLPEGIQSRHHEHQFQDQGRIVHKTKFLSNAADLEYSTLSDIINQDTLLGKVPVSVLYNGTDSPTPSSDTVSSTQGACLNQQQSQQQVRSALSGPQGFRSPFHNLLGPHTEEILNSNVDLYTVHYPLVPEELTDCSRHFRRRQACAGIQRKNKCDKTVNQHFLSTEYTLPEIKASPYSPTGNGYLSFSLESRSPDEHQTHAHSEWPHSLRYSTPMEIYTLITEPFSYTSGFHSLLKYLHSRFKRRDLLDMCRSIAEFRPIFIASAIDLTEEDMIFMEQSYQRTLLEYDRFISQIGTPTCVWRRNGQISYLNDEFTLLTGWTREELLSKMTFVVELMDDESVREYFKTFSEVAYKEFKGSEKTISCRLLSPIKNKTTDCCCMWTWKRDVFGMPMMIVGHFLPILPLPDDTQRSSTFDE